MKHTNRMRNVRSFIAAETMRIAAFALLLSSAQVRSEESNPVSSISWGSVDCALVTDDARMLVLVVSQWPHAHLYQRLSVLDVLAEKLSVRDRCRISGNVAGAERYDMTVVAGRAAWMMERMMQVELPAIATNATPEDLTKLQAVGKQMVAEYRAQAMERHRKLIQEPPAEHLKAKYAGRITFGIKTNVFASCKMFSCLLGEWFPLEKNMKELEYIVGANAASAAGGKVYYFDNGLVGAEFFFKMEAGKIKGVFVGTPR